MPQSPQRFGAARCWAAVAGVWSFSLCPGGVFAAATTTAPAGYDHFTLVTVKVGGVLLRIQEPMAGRKEELAKVLREYLDEEKRAQAKAEKLAGRSDELLADIQRLVGFEASGRQKTEYRRMLRFFLQPTRLYRPGRKTTVYLLDQDDVKQYLRDGGTLPDFTYDKASDKAQCVFMWGRWKSEPNPNRPLAVPLPLPKDDPVETLREALEAIREGLSISPCGLAIHELAECGMLFDRLRPADLRIRWFSDGFATAAAIHLLPKYVGAKEAEAFAARWAPDPDGPAIEEVNLLAWCALAPLEVGHPAEKALSRARYAYATLEARRLMDAHGPGVLKKILDEVCKHRPVRAATLLAAASKVCREDLGKRLCRYQTANSGTELFKDFHKRCQRATEGGDRETAVLALLRMHELVSNQPEAYARISYLLQNGNLAAAVDQAFFKRAGLAMQNDTPDRGRTWLRAFCAYAMQVQRPRIAAQPAEKLLDTDPDDVLALTVRLHDQAGRRQTDEAVATAERILQLAPKDSLPHREATRMLRRLRSKRPPATGQAQE